jgi:hypothetical protein
VVLPVRGIMLRRAYAAHDAAQTTMVMNFEHGHQRKANGAPGSLWLGALRLIVPAWPMALVWSLIVANYALHVFGHSSLITPSLLVGGHAVLAMQIACFIQTSRTHPGSPPVEWHDHAPDGVPLLPPRALHVREFGVTVLGFDHKCVWMGVCVGFRNRKFFVLFLLWSVALSMMGTAFCAMTLLGMMTLGSSQGGRQDVHSHEMALRASEAAYAQLIELHASGRVNLGMAYLVWFAQAFVALEPASMKRAVAVILLLWIDAVAGIMLGAFACYHVYLVCRNRTTLRPRGEEEYDLGCMDNWRQVFGSNVWAWWLPCGGPEGDGINWPRRPRP